MAGLDRNGVRGIVREFAHALIHAGVLFVAAGSARWANAWVCIALSLAYQAANALVLGKYNPGLLNERGKLAREDTTRFDVAFIAIYIPLGLATSAVAGLDAVRFGWSRVPLWLSAAGAALYIAACCLGTWAMAVNKHFETTVRIQSDRGHRVCGAGPYGAVRHPGYAAAIAGLVAYPLILGSWRALAPAAAMVILFIVRTALEDRFLMRELPGYAEFAGKTRYRLAPFIW